MPWNEDVEPEVSEGSRDGLTRKPQRFVFVTAPASADPAEAPPLAMKKYATVENPHPKHFDAVLGEGALEPLPDWTGVPGKHDLVDEGAIGSEPLDVRCSAREVGARIDGLYGMPIPEDHDRDLNGH